MRESITFGVDGKAWEKMIIELMVEGFTDLVMMIVVEPTWRSVGGLQTGEDWEQTAVTSHKRDNSCFI